MNHLASPLTNFHRLEPTGDNPGLVNVVIDTPRGSQYKYKYDEQAGVFRLSKRLPLGAMFPYDFGFLPATRGDDGDALDVLVLLEEPAALGCVVPVRLIGVILAHQVETDGKTVRNDRLVGVLETVYNSPEIRALDDLSPQRLDEIEHFFISYNEMEGRTFKPEGRKGAKDAQRIVEGALRQPPHQQEKGRAKAAH